MNVRLLEGNVMLTSAISSQGRLGSYLDVHGGL
jgi:hypothetical protein